MRNATFVGFGFGPIQSGLFLYEAFASGNFSRLVIAEVDPALVQAVRAAGGRYAINIASDAGVRHALVSGVELLNPRVEEDRLRLIEAIGQADELATSLPSVSFYESGGDLSVASLLAAGWAGRVENKPAIVYTAENNNHAAEFLAAAVAKAGGQTPPNVQFLNTVIGKMSGVLTEPEQIRRLKLTPLTPAASRAVLVEEFNRILISKITLADFPRRVAHFVEKTDLLPFEEAKLYGHNAIHALLGYLGQEKGLTSMSQLPRKPEILQIGRQAFGEAGQALCRKYDKLDDLFTPGGWNDHAENLLKRMVCPYLNDQISRVCRDPKRKLAREDRLIGAMRLALAHQVEPANLALGAAAALRFFLAAQAAKTFTPDSAQEALTKVWGDWTEADWPVARWVARN